LHAFLDSPSSCVATFPHQSFALALARAGVARAEVVVLEAQAVAQVPVDLRKTANSPALQRDTRPILEVSTSIHNPAELDTAD
jgi:hypothetical protein